MAPSRPTLARERVLWREGASVVCGMDEAGRGPLAGPVVAAAVVLSPFSSPFRGLNDSKLLAPKARARVARNVERRAMAFAIAAASVREIDRVNIRRATVLAMQRAIARLPTKPDVILVDGPPMPELGFPHEGIVDGDAHCQSIAAASVLAKVARDALMRRLARRHPTYHWDTNMGYATREHLDAVAECGPTAHHRRTFGPIAQLPLGI